MARINIYYLSSLYYRFKNADIKDIFTDDNSIKFKEFIKQFELYQHNCKVLTNYYSAMIILKGVREFANDNFWKILNK